MSAKPSPPAARWRAPYDEAEHPVLRALGPHRLAAWRALSDLFLDTEIDDAAVASMARTLSPGPLSLQDLEEVVFHELAPGLGKNLLSVAGAWALFDDDDLARHVRPWAERKSQRIAVVGPLTRRLEKRFWRTLVGADWDRVRGAIEDLRANPSATASTMATD